MDQIKNQLLFALLRSAVCGMQLTEEERNAFSSEVLQDLMDISAKHDVIHLLAVGLNKNKLLSKDEMNIKKYILKAVYRYERIEQEYKKICKVFEEMQVPFLPLKGSVIREYYPEAWMRTSCDIDILMKEEDAEKAKTILVNEHGYTYQGKGSHDLSLFSPNNTHIELHYDLVEDGIANESSEVLRNVWATASVREGYNYFYEMPDEIYYFYHIAHMAKHFENGGCGIRPLIDLLILDKLQEADKEKRDKVLLEGKLLKFANAARKLSRIWFENEAYDPTTKRMETFILRGGVYGSTENRVTIQQQKKGGRLKYALSRIVIPYEALKFQYPILQKYRWLTPIMEVCRWGELIFGGRFKRSVKEMKYNSRVTSDEATDAKKILESIGLY